MLIRNFFNIYVNSYIELLTKSFWKKSDPKKKPNINLIILGTGNSTGTTQSKMIKNLNDCGIALETTASLQACSTYNLLCTEQDGEGVALFVRGSSLPLFVELSGQLVVNFT